MADKLTLQQAQAVADRGGMLLVSAAAGSGKTKVLVDRLLSYIMDPNDPAELDQFLIITYTKAAASELRGKIAAKLTEHIAADPENRHLQKQMQRLYLTKISTVHGFCGDILREYAYRLDIPADFRVADEDECREIRETVMEALLDRAYGTSMEDADFCGFVDTQGLGRDDRLVPELIEKVFDSARCHLDPQGWLNQCLVDAQLDDVEDASQTVWGQYLLQELMSYLSDQLLVLKKCAEWAENCDGMEKVSQNLRSTILQLESLYESKTWDEVAAAGTIEYGRLVFPKKAADPELCDRIKAARNACKKNLAKKLTWFTNDSGQVLRDLGQCASGTRGLVSLVNQFGQEFSAAKRSRHVLDFGDLEHKMLDLLLGKSRGGITAAAKEIGSRYREIMVDEYQDSNGVQDAIFYALTRERKNCFMVGDVKQSIYQFRLADPGIFLQKYNSFTSVENAEPGQGRKILLSHNFRSGAEVIEAVNAVFSKTMNPQVGGLYYGDAEALREGIPHEVLPDPGVELYGLEVREDTYAEEAAFVAQQIQNMLQSGATVRKNGKLMPVEPEDIVILLRSPGSIGTQYQEALEARGIRCTTGGGVDLMKTQEIAVLRSVLQVIVNPRQDIPLLSALASPVFGFTADDLAAVRAGKRSGSFYESLLHSDSAKAASFLSALGKLRVEARMKKLTQLLESVFRLTRLDSIFGSMPGGTIKSKNLQTFYQLAAEFESTNLRDLNQFLEHLDALEERGLIRSGSASAGCVTLMSIHKSKGLEFPVVFLCGLGREFNRESLNAQILCDRELGLGLSVTDKASRIRYPSIAKRAIAAKMQSESISEELRVLYVAMTRARDRLVMVYSSRKLASDLEEIALRMDFDSGKLLCREASCPGDWVLMTAICRMEAGEFHNLGGRPNQLEISDRIWKIAVAHAPDHSAAENAVSEPVENMPENAYAVLKNALEFRYGHLPATLAPSKQTATGRKGRLKDDEAAEDTEEPKYIHRTWRKPSFMSGRIEGKAYGNAIHTAMQYIRYENCGDLDGVKSELHRLEQETILGSEETSALDPACIAAFFDSEIGQKLRCGTEHLREFKFSILDDASQYGDGLDGEKVLLQGVVDCALLEADGITVVDFKTDHVTEETLEQRAELYRPQVITYADALSRIYEMPMKARYLYFFRLNRFVEV